MENSVYKQRISSHQNRLFELLAAAPVKYSEWAVTDTSDLATSAGVYHFFEIHEDDIVSLYVGKGGFGGDNSN